jgi:hypothetical protein
MSIKIKGLTFCNLILLGYSPPRLDNILVGMDAKTQKNMVSIDHAGQDGSYNLLISPFNVSG